MRIVPCKATKTGVALSVGPEGKVEKIFRRVKVDGHVEAVIEAITKLRAAKD